MNQNHILSIASSVARAHKEVIDQLSEAVINKELNGDDIDAVRSLVTKMGAVEAVIVEAMGDDARKQISGVLSSIESTSGKGTDGKLYEELNSALGFPIPMAEQEVMSDIAYNAAAIAGLLIYTYSCCKSDKTGVMIGMGLGVKGCDDNFHIGSCP